MLPLSCLHCREAPQLTAVLKEMKEGLDAVRTKVEALTPKVGSFARPISLEYDLAYKC